MTSVPAEGSKLFTEGTKAAFWQYLAANPSNRRVSPSEKVILVQWLTDPEKHPCSQQEFSRRNYVKKAFYWDERTQTLVALAREGEDHHRKVITADMIVDVVEHIHRVNNHPGWDNTWKRISAEYYGILRADVIFLLKRCQDCARNPAKRPRGAVIPSSSSAGVLSDASASMSDYYSGNVESRQHVWEDERSG